MTSNNKHDKQGKQVKDRSNRNGDKETRGCDSRSSFLLRGTTSSLWRGVETTHGYSKRRTGSPYSPLSAPVKVTSSSTKRRPSRVASGTLVVGAVSTTQLECYQPDPSLHKSPCKLGGEIFRLGFLEPKSNKYLNGKWGEIKSLW